MRVLWLCNIMLPMIAQQFGVESSNKEGWLSGLADRMLEEQEESGVSLFVAFPAPERLLPKGEEILEKELSVNGRCFTCYGFRENVRESHVYDPKLERQMKEILQRAKPDVVHCFGTEYPHTRAMCEICPDKSRLLITIQGLCSVYATVYEADLPDEVVHGATLRDRLKKDSLTEQKEKFCLRGENEIRAIKLAGNIGGRTAWDRYYAEKWHAGVRYFEMGETLRSNFYEGRWSRENCESGSIFLSQGDYPIKGLHYMLLALPKILKEVPDAHVYVAGDNITAYKTWKEKLKISGYGKYLRQLIKRYGLEGKVTFLGRQDSGQMKDRYLRSQLFVCPSAIENSPNSLGEAMILGMPCVAAQVGGIASIFTHGEDGICYGGCPAPEEIPGAKAAGPKEGVRSGGERETLSQVAENLATAVLDMWRNEEKEREYCKNARAHALRNHDREENYRKTLEVYNTIANGAEKKV